MSSLPLLDGGEACIRRNDTLLINNHSGANNTPAIHHSILTNNNAFTDDGVGNAHIVFDNVVYREAVMIRGRYARYWVRLPPQR